MSGNTAGGGGGSIFNFTGLVMLTNSTVSGNTTAEDGGGITHGCCVTVTTILTNSTVTNNTASSGQGGSISNDSSFSSTIKLANTIVANNSSGGDCAGSITSLGHNLDSDGTCNLMEPTDLASTDPLLGPLADNDGPTFTHMLLPGSPAIDAVPVADCTDADGNPFTTDQRGVARPLDGDGDGIAFCDIGAYELSGVVNLVVVDFDADRRTDVAVYDESTGDWFFVGSTSGFGLQLNFGGVGFIPVPGDYDRDGVTDPAVYEEGTGNWFIVQSTEGFRIHPSFGGAGFIPMLPQVTILRVMGLL